MIINKIASHGTASIGNAASATILASNARRRYAGIYNSTANGLWLGLGTAAVVGTGIYVPPNGGVFEMDGDNIWRGAVNGIATAGAANVIGTIELY